MKTILGAIALCLAVPAVAQNAPAADPHAGHADHEKGKHDCKECCQKMKQQHGKMERMDKKGDTKPASSSQHDHQAHQGKAH
jgi:hypothetical protein